MFRHLRDASGLQQAFEVIHFPKQAWKPIFTHSQVTVVLVRQVLKLSCYLGKGTQARLWVRGSCYLEGGYFCPESRLTWVPLLLNYATPRVSMAGVVQEPMDL